MEENKENSGNDALINAILKMIENESSPETIAIKNQIMQRVATESEIRPSRMPAPLNITEIGGYYNLLTKLNEQEMQKRLVASALGLPMD